MSVTGFFMEPIRHNGNINLCLMFTCRGSSRKLFFPSLTFFPLRFLILLFCASHSRRHLISWLPYVYSILNCLSLENLDTKTSSFYLLITLSRTRAHTHTYCHNTHTARTRGYIHILPIVSNRLRIFIVVYVLCVIVKLTGRIKF